MGMFFRASIIAAVLASAFAGQVLFDGTNNLKTSSIPASLMADDLVAVISSPQTPSTSSLPQPDSFLSLESNCLACRGPTLALSPVDPEWKSISLCSLTAAAVVLDGITEGDLEAGLKNSRHGITLTALFRARANLEGTACKQVLILYVDGEVSASSEKEVKGEVLSLFSAATAENKDFVPFDKAYDLRVVSSQSQAGNEVRLVKSFAMEVEH